MNQRSSSIERCFAYGALMDDSVALINKATTSNRAGCVYNKLRYVFYPTDDVNVILVDWPHDFINVNYKLSIVTEARTIM